MKKFFIVIMASLFGAFSSINAQSYKMQVEKADGTVISLPADFVKQVTFIPAETFSISYSLSGVVSSNNETSISEGMPYSTVLTVDDNYYISSINILMNGYDITSSSYSEGKITIQEVTGNISITATALPYSEGVDLSAKGMANCYIVSESGTYKFSIEGYSGSSAFLLWNELGANDISDVELKGNYIFFKKNSFQKGNAVISLTDATNTIVWSWHIWSTDVPSTINYNGTKWMDRNLGATTADYTSEDSYGMYYLFGNPMPFPGYKYKDFTISETPSVPNGWYVAEGYGFYKSTKMPSPSTPMQICSNIDAYGNSTFFRNPSNPCPANYYCSGIQGTIGYEPVVDSYGINLGDGLYFPLAGGHYGYGYQCPSNMSCYWSGFSVYNSAAVVGSAVYFQDGLSKRYYNNANAGAPMRAASY